MPTRKPAREVRLGKIKAAIWANESDRGLRHNVTVSLLYKDGEDWKSSDSFRRDDIPLLVKVLDRVHDALYDPADDQA